MLCEYCKRKFKNESSLKTHQKTALYCLKTQNKKIEEHKCNTCEKSFSTKYVLKYHKINCVKNDVINELKIENFKLKEKARKLTILTKSKYLTDILLPEEKLDKLIDENLSEKHISLGQIGLAYFVSEYLINPIVIENGIKIQKINYTCTDFSRYQFSFLDKYGNLQKDRHALKLIEMIRIPVGKKINTCLNLHHDTMVDLASWFTNNSIEFCKQLSLLTTKIKNENNIN